MSAVDVRGILQDFLARMDLGEMPEFDELLRAHPEQAGELRRLFEEECERLEQSPLPSRISARPSEASADFSAEVVARLAGRAKNYERYSVRREIGRGGMGAVLQVWDEDLRRNLAMKVTRSDASVAAGGSEVSKLARFLEEAQVTGQLDHPGIVPVHELGLDPEGRVYFTMKLVKGRTFAEVLDLVRDRAEGWTQARALGVIQRVCEAMAYAHDKGVLHRDLKPANVMVGAFGEVYVMDWGLARIVGTEDRLDIRVRVVEDGPVASDREERRGMDPSSSLLTMDGQVVGTPAYMPPEQAAGKVEEVGPHSDVYAVGAMIYHLLAGRPPHVRTAEERDEVAVWRRVQSESPAPLPASAPAELAAICEKALAPDWRARYGDMAGMAADVSAFLEGRVVHAYETGTLAEARKWIRRNRGLSASIAAAVLALVVGLVASLALKARADGQSFRAGKIASFLEETLSGVTPSVALGRDTTMLRDMMDAAWARVEAGELARAPEAEQRLTRLIGAAYRDLGQYARAELVLRRSVDRARAVYAADDPELASSQIELAVLLHLTGEYDEAESLARSALDLRRRRFPGDSPAVAASLETLASVRHAKGDLAEAERLYGEALDIHRRLYTADHEQVALNMSNLAVVMQARGELDGAEGLLRESLEMRRRLVPGDHPDIAGHLNNLAEILFIRGDAGEAERLHREALEMRRRVFPGDHSELAVSLNNLATVLQARGDHDGAEKLYTECLDMQRRLHAGDHVDTASTIGNLAALYQIHGDLSRAESLQREGLAMSRRLFPDGHPSLPSDLHNLSVLLRARGELAEAEELGREGLEMMRRLVPGDHRDTISLASNLAQVLDTRGDFPGAEELFRESLEMSRRLYPPGHARIARSLDNLASLLAAHGDPVAAEPLYRELLESYRALHGAAHPRTGRAAAGLAKILADRGSFAEAEQVLLETVQGEPGGPEWTASRERRRCLEVLTETYAGWERSEPGAGHGAKAEPWAKELAERREQ